jgi:hypothetical protein
MGLWTVAEKFGDLGSEKKNSLQSILLSGKPTERGKHSTYHMGTHWVAQ